MKNLDCVVLVPTYDRRGSLRELEIDSDRIGDNLILPRGHANDLGHVCHG